MGTFGNVAAQSDDNGVGDDSGQMNGMDGQFRQMEREMYVSALTGEQTDSDGTGVAVFLPEEGMEGPAGPDDDPTSSDPPSDGPGDDTDSGPDNGTDSGPGDDTDSGSGDDPSDDSTAPSDNAASAQSDSLQYHIFIANVDNPVAVTLNEGVEGEDGEVVETLVDFAEGGDSVGDNGVGDDGADDNATDDNGPAGTDGADAQDLSGTLEEPIVVTGSIGGGSDVGDNGVGDNGMDDNGTDDDVTDDNATDDNGIGDNGIGDNGIGDNGEEGSEFDVQEFKQNPWEYYISVEGEDEDALIRGQVTTGLLAGEEDLEDRVEDDEPGDSDEPGDDDGVGDGTDDDDGVGDGTDDDGGIGDDNATDDT